VRCAGALWKLSMSEDNVKTFQELELVPVLINLLKENAEGLDDLQFNVGKIQVRIFLKFKGTVARAFQPQIFFINQPHLGLWFIP
jgi:hypothetical protein